MELGGSQAGRKTLLEKHRGRPKNGLGLVQAGCCAPGGAVRVHLGLAEKSGSLGDGKVKEAHGKTG